MSDNTFEEISDFGAGIDDALHDPVTVIVVAVQLYLGDYVNAAITLGGSAAARTYAPDLGSLGGYNADSLNNRGKRIQFRSPIAARQVVYGKTRTSGVILRLDSKDANNTLQLQIALSGAPIDSITAHYVNEEIVRTSHQDANGYSGNRLLNTDSSSTYYTHMKCQVAYGGNQTYPNQLANANWTQTATIDGTTYSNSSFTYDNIAYAYVEMYYDATVYKTGTPAHSFEVKGCQIYDPRNSSTAWSANPALVIRDYLTNEVYGLACTASEIDDTSFIAAANVCDEQVGGENRYEINGIVDTARAPKAILEDMLTACVGKLVYSGGKFKLLVGEYQTPTKTITKDMIIGDVQIGTKNPARNQINSVKGTFVDEDDNYLTTDFTPITEGVYFFEDDAEDSFIDLTLPFTTSKAMAERIAEITLRQVRNQKSLSMILNLEGFDIDVGDTVYYTDSRLGFDQATFECMSWTLEQDGLTPRISVVLKETNPNLFDTTVEIAPIVRNAIDAATSTYNGISYVTSSQDLETVFGSYWTQDIAKEYLIPEDCIIQIALDDRTNTNWVDTESPVSYTAAGAEKYIMTPCLVVPANFKGSLIIRNRGQIYARGGIGGYAYNNTFNHYMNYSVNGSKGGDVIHWETSATDYRPTDAGTLLVVNDGTIGAGGGGNQGASVGTTYSEGVYGTGAQFPPSSSQNTTATAILVSGSQYRRGGRGQSDYGDRGNNFETSTDGGLTWTGPTAGSIINNGWFINVGDDYDAQVPNYTGTGYVQDSNQKTRIKVNNRGTIGGDLSSTFSTLDSIFVE